MNAHEKNAKATSLAHQLEEFDRTIAPLVGVRPFENQHAFVWQLIDSLQRIDYVKMVVNRRARLSSDRANPASSLFDPVQAAVLLREQNFEEACWLVFISTHCGRNLRKAWMLAGELYGGLGQHTWTWAEVSDDPEAVQAWLRVHHHQFNGTFGNHRKYESIKDVPAGTGRVIASYVAWINSFGSHSEMFAHARSVAQGDRRKAFNLLYQSMRQVSRFGRTGRFDYLTMIAKVGLADIDAYSTYLNEATGPLRGARLFFDGQIDSASSARTLEGLVAALDSHLGVGMQALEDSMCNWQKSPNKYVAFRG